MIPYVRTGGLHLHVVLGKVSVRYGRAMLVEVILYCNVETSGTFLVQMSQRSPTNASHPCSPWSARVSRRFDFPLSAGVLDTPEVSLPFTSLSLPPPALHHGRSDPSSSRRALSPRLTFAQTDKVHRGCTEPQCRRWEPLPTIILFTDVPTRRTHSLTCVRYMMHY